jgi:hypothetical protein
VKVEYISHACLLIDTGDARIATDPWFAGPAYSQQWHVFPRPVNAQAVEAADVITISHGHEDHFHSKTLRGLQNKSAQVFYPYSWFGGAKEFIESLGFAKVSEAVNWREYRLTRNTSVTYVANGRDNIMVVQSGNQVLVNVNDALHSEPNETIDFFIGEIRNHWPRIDTLFCGFGGASYFPNMLHVEGKDDVAVGVVREQLFAHNFCRVVAGLKPRVAVPFAADFALLAPAERWINDVRFPRARMKDYYQQHFAKDGLAPEIYEMYPGDVLDGAKLQGLSPYRGMLMYGQLNHLLEQQYAEEIARKQSPRILIENEANLLADDLRGHINSRATSLEATKVASLTFCLKILDVGERNCYNISFKDGAVRLERAPKAQADCHVVIAVPSRILRYSMKYEFGGDAIGIGYGADFHLRDREVVAANLDQACYGLLTRGYSTRKNYLKENPRRVFSYVVRQPPVHTWKSWKKSASRLGNVNYDRSIWLLRDADALRQIFGLPMLAEDKPVAAAKSCV